MSIVRIDCRRIINWDTLHDVFKEAFGFPDFYGRNMNAWIDCMTSLDAPLDGMTTVHATPGCVVTMQLEYSSAIASPFNEQYQAIIECTAFVNWRRINVGEPAVLALSFWAKE